MRIRSIMIDNTSGRLYTGVSKFADVLANNVIAGKLPSTKNITNKLILYNTKRAAALTLSSSSCLVTKITTTLSRPPVFADLVITINLRSNTNIYAAPTTIGTITVPINSTTAPTWTQAFDVTADQYVSIDVAYSNPSGARAAGLTMSFTYFPAAL
jgi:hypothetical protein